MLGLTSNFSFISVFEFNKIKQLKECKTTFFMVIKSCGFFHRLTYKIEVRLSVLILFKVWQKKISKHTLVPWHRIHVMLVKNDEIFLLS